MNTQNSKRLFERANKYIPGGVNSPVRAFKSVGLEPIFIDRAKGSKIYDVDGNEYIDFVCSWGPLILGHSNDEIKVGIEEIFKKGTSYGMPSPIEVEVAEAICNAYPSVDMIRMVNSGTEATMSALRVARAYTKRNIIIKFEGCYHGHCDSLLVKSGSGTLTFGTPTSPGVPEDIIKNTVVCRYNDLQNVREVFEKIGDEVAAIIVEPVACNMGVVAPKEGFLQGLRNICNKYGALLIFDEVITGFRLSYGGAQQVFGVEPDLTCFGKIIGGGLPVGAYGGKKEIMSIVSPMGPVYQAGTLSGNPLAMHMGYKTIKILQSNQNIYDELELKAKVLEEGFNKIIEELNIDLTFIRVRSMTCLFFAKSKFESYEDVTKCDTKKYAQFFEGMLNRGVLFPPAQFEGLFLSTAHTMEQIKYTLETAKEVLKEIYEIK